MMGTMCETRGTIQLAKSIEDFTLDFSKSVLNKNDQNFVSSALSAHTVLSMSACGAKEETAKQMHHVLYLQGTNSLSNYKYLIEIFNNQEYVTFRVVNKIYIDNRIIVKDTFKQDIKSIFHSDVEGVNFATEGEATVKAINNWYAKQTNNKIKGVISIDDIDHTTRLILTNAVYFKASWASKFASDMTSLKPFHVDETTAIRIPTMHEYANLYYKDLKAVDAECVALPYKDYDFLFVIILPKKVGGLKSIEKNLNKIELHYQDDFGKYGHNMRDIFLALPKFKLETTIDLNTHLYTLGMVKAFSKSANFKGISEKPVLDPPLHIDKVLQKVFIEVNEDGTEAVATTRMGLRGGGPTPEWYSFKIDRPFLYRIVNVHSNVTLFSGRVVRPTCP